MRAQSQPSISAAHDFLPVPRASSPSCGAQVLLFDGGLLHGVIPNIALQAMLNRLNQFPGQAQAAFKQPCRSCMGRHTTLRNHPSRVPH